MKMAKATEQDIDAAGEAMGVLQSISGGYYPGVEDDAPLHFDPDDPEHLRKFYDLMNATLDKSPGWPGRVIGGMCYVILYDKNQIIDPDSDCLELHPRFAALQQHQPGEVPGTVKPGDCIHCGKEICNDLGWCNSFKAAPGVVPGEGNAVVAGGPAHVPDSELPGMWERADFEGGQDEVRGPDWKRAVPGEGNERG